MGQRIVQVDAFTDRAFAGNPAGICVMETARDEGWMKAVAREMNLSETAYLVREGSGFRLRWFTPEVEVKLCGHATVASAHLLWEEGYVGLGDACVFYTLSGELTARRNGDWVEVSMPSLPPRECPVPTGLEAALGAKVVYFGENANDYGLAVLESEAAVRGLAPDFLSLSKLPRVGYGVTARSDDKPYAFVSRFFAPNAGINEDPVTGSAHCMLAPYWGGVLGRTEMLAYQASVRGGVVRTRVEGDRVIVGGQAVTVLRGELVD